MKKRLFSIGFLLAFAAEIVALVVFSVQSPTTSRDAVAINEVVQTVTRDFYALDKHENNTVFDYVVLDRDGNILYKTRSGLSESINAAIAHGDTILDITPDDAPVGKVIVYDDGAQALHTQRRTATAVLATAVALSAALCVSYALYIRHTVIRPFGKLKGLAERIAGGNLDVPLEMDRRNLFGAFTESFDIMRSELKKARLAEAQANASKKELVAKLSHDIKTPVASIKAVSEVGLEVAANEKDRANYAQIVGKADEINILVTNLFTATLEELQELSVTPSNIESPQIKTMLENADYLRRAAIPDIPECLLYADGLRLQQVFDNIFANAYKYANTDITLSARKNGDFLDIVAEDFGGGVKSEELPTLKEKFKRGSNAKNIEGAGLGLYISDCFMSETGGALTVENGTHGLKVTVRIPLSGRAPLPGI